MTAERVARSYSINHDRFNFQTTISGTRPRSRGAKRPSCACILRLHKAEGRGECRVADAPAASRRNKKHTRVVTTGPPAKSGIPARNGFNGLLRALPGYRACLSPSLADKACLRRVGPTCLRELDGQSA